MEATGTIVKILPIENGTTKAGAQFTKFTIIVRYAEDTQYPKELAVTYLTKAAEAAMQVARVGAKVTAKFDCTSREYNGRYYTEAIGWKLDALTVQQPAPMQAPQYSAPNPPAYAQATQQPMYAQPIYQQQPYAAPQAPAQSDGLPF